MRIIIEAFLFACVMSFFATGNVFGEWSNNNGDETEINYSDSWNLGRPDNIPETEVIIMGRSCECPQ